MHTLIATAFTKWITSIFGWVIAIVLVNGAIVHVLNILGKGKGPWGEFPVLWRTMDVALLIFNVAVALGLAFRQTWSVYALFAGIVLLQIVPYTVFRSKFATTAEDHATLNGLIGTEIALLIVFAGLIVWQGKGGGV